MLINFYKIHQQTNSFSTFSNLLKAQLRQGSSKMRFWPKANLVCVCVSLRPCACVRVCCAPCARAFVCDGGSISHSARGLHALGLPAPDSLAELALHLCAQPAAAAPRPRSVDVVARCERKIVAVAKANGTLRSSRAAPAPWY